VPGEAGSDDRPQTKNVNGIFIDFASTALRHSSVNVIGCV